MTSFARKLARKAKARIGGFSRIGSKPLGSAPADQIRNLFDPRINRHTGKPHEHKREIARNARRVAA